MSNIRPIAILAATALSLSACGSSSPSYNVPEGKTINGESPQAQFLEAVNAAGPGHDGYVLKKLHTDLCTNPDLADSSARAMWVTGAIHVKSPLDPEVTRILDVLDKVGCGL